MSMSEDYRPVRFEDMWQWPDSPVLKIITNGIRDDNLDFPILLRGHYGEGKTTLACILGRRRCCDQKHLHPFEPCGTCEGCKSVDLDWTGGFSEWGYREYDCTAVTSERLRRCIGEDTAGNPWKNINTDTRWLVCLDELGHCSDTFQHTLLKRLDKGTADYILCVATEDKIIPELSQRCSEYRLKPPTVDQCCVALDRIARIEGIELDPNAARLLSSRFGCNPRTILKALPKARSLSTNHKVGIKEIKDVIEMQAA